MMKVFSYQTDTTLSLDGLLILFVQPSVFGTDIESDGLQYNL